MRREILERVPQRRHLLLDAVPDSGFWLIDRPSYPTLSELLDSDWAVSSVRRQRRVLTLVLTAEHVAFGCYRPKVEKRC